MKRISFIVPCYKTPRIQLKHCLDSVAGLDSDNWEWEVIVVDDGTPGTHIRTCVEDMADDRFHYFYQKNSGQGQARNVGLRHAVGEYVHFLDSDDYLLRKSFSRCLDIVAEKAPDMLMFDYQKVDSSGYEEPQWEMRDGFCETTGVDYLLKRSMLGVVCNVIVRRSILDGLEFRSGIYHEDEEFAPLMLLRVKSLIVTDIKAYAYRQNQCSTMGNKSEENLERRFKDFLTVVDALRHSLDSLSGKEAKAMQRRVDQLCESFVYNLIMLSPGKPFFCRWFMRLKETGIYPVPYKMYNLKYILFCMATDKPWKMKILYKIFNRR